MRLLTAPLFVFRTSRAFSLMSRLSCDYGCFAAQGLPHTRKPFVDAGSNFPPIGRQAADHAPNVIGGRTGASARPATRYGHRFESGPQVRRREAGSPRQINFVSMSFRSRQRGHVEGVGIRFAVADAVDCLGDKEGHPRVGLPLFLAQSMKDSFNSLPRVEGSFVHFSLPVLLHEKRRNREIGCRQRTLLRAGPRRKQSKIDMTTRGQVAALVSVSRRSCGRGDHPKLQPLSNSYSLGRHVGLLVGRAARRLASDGLLVPAGHRRRYPHFPAMGVHLMRRDGPPRAGSSRASILYRTLGKHSIQFGPDDGYRQHPNAVQRNVRPVPVGVWPAGSHGCIQRQGALTSTKTSDGSPQHFRLTGIKWFARHLEFDEIFVDPSRCVKDGCSNRISLRLHAFILPQIVAPRGEIHRRVALPVCQRVGLQPIRHSSNGLDMVQGVLNLLGTATGLLA